MESSPKVIPSLEYHQPVQASLETLQAYSFEYRVVAGDFPAPFGVVVSDVFSVPRAPSAANLAILAEKAIQCFLDPVIGA